MWQNTILYMNPGKNIYFAIPKLLIMVINKVKRNATK